MEIYLADAIAAFAFVLTYLMTDNRYMIILVFTLIVLFHDVRLGETPIITLPKLILGRTEIIRGLSIIMSQIAGMVLAYVVYKLLVKHKMITKHILDS